jgi:ACS family glucarate transporter-like MFS transporter
VRHLVLIALLAITAINYIQRNSIGPAETTVRKELRLSIGQSGDIVSSFFLTYALLQIPSGWLAQRWGPRRALTLFAAGWSLALGLGALATGMAGLLLARLALGALQAGVFSCATLVLLAWYPASRRGLATALLNSAMLIGGAAGSMFTGELVGPLGWRWVFALYAVPGLVWSAWFLWWFRDRPQDHPGVNPAELAVITEDSSPPARALPGRIPWAVIFLNLSLVLLYVQQFCRAGSARFFDTWLVTYLQESRGLKVARAGVLASMPLWTGVVGGVVGGIISDAVLRRTHSRRAARQGVAVASLAGALLCYVIAYPIADIVLASVVMSLGAFLVTFSAPCAYALTLDMGGRHLGIVFGAMNMAGNLGSFAFTWLMPQLKGWTGHWEAGLALFVGMQAVALACWVFLDPRGVVGEPDVAAFAKNAGSR